MASFSCAIFRVSFQNQSFWNVHLQEQNQCRIAGKSFDLKTRRGNPSRERRSFNQHKVLKRKDGSFKRLFADQGRKQICLADFFSLYYFGWFVLAALPQESEKGEVFAVPKDTRSCRKFRRAMLLLLEKKKKNTKKPLLCRQTRPGAFKSKNIIFIMRLKNKYPGTKLKIFFPNCKNMFLKSETYLV